MHVEIHVVYVCVGQEIGYLCWKSCSYDGCGLGVGHVFGKLVCVHCCWAGGWRRAQGLCGPKGFKFEAQGKKVN
jgi:hypothetical protein